MTRPADDRPTTVLPQQTVEQPSVTTSPATRRSYTWHRRIPARIGRARTSTVVIGALFVLLGGLNTVLPQRDTGTTPVVLPSGQTVEVPNSSLPSEARPTTTTPTDPTVPDPVPAPTSAEPTGTRAPSPTPDEEEPEATPTPTPTSTPRSTPSSTPTPSSTARSTATTQAPSTTAGTPSEELVPEETADPTG